LTPMWWQPGRRSMRFVNCSVMRSSRPARCICTPVRSDSARPWTEFRRPASHRTRPQERSNDDAGAAAGCS
jgi:hypothetical protein